MTVGWAMISTGRVSERMATALAKQSNSEVVAVLSRSRETGEAYAAKHGGPTVYTSLEEIIADDAVEAFYVASPNALHPEQVIAIANAGKHSLCEKPMSLDEASCTAMIQAAEDNDTLLGLNFQYRHHPAHIYMRDALQSGEFGDGFFADAEVRIEAAGVPAWYNDTKLSGGGGVMSLAGVHRLDIFRFILGAEVTEVAGFVSTRDRDRAYDDQVTAVLRFDNGVEATVRFGLGLARGLDPLAFHYTKGSLISTGTTSHWWYQGAGWVDVHTDGDITRKDDFVIDDLYGDSAEAFANAVGGAPMTGATGIDGLRALQIAAAIKSAAKERTTIELSY